MNTMENDMDNVKNLWTKKNVDKLFRMKRVGHKSYSQISRSIGCKVKDAQAKYLMKNAKKSWSKNHIDRIVRMKKVGHKSYAQISRAIGCKAKDAQAKYLSMVS
jgi:Holliday junction resolvasome RuvABC DNA-binding subunit